MQDRFKFRIWDEKEKKMHENVTDLSIFNNEHLIIMQCTGLKDKNGTLEYQGDLLKDILGNIYELVYQVSSCGFLLYNHKEDEYYYPCNNVNQFKNRNITEMEVIGNIYENPKLLEATND